MNKRVIGKGANEREGIHFDQSQAGRDDLHTRYSGLADGGTYDPVNFERLSAGAGTYRGSGGGGGGGRITAQNIKYKGIDPSRANFNAVSDPDRVNYNAINDPERINYNTNEHGKGAYETLAQTGGYDDVRRASVEGQVKGLQEFGRTGGLDDEAIGRFRGSGVFDEFARTGGYSDADQANIRARSLSPIGSYATGTQDELNRRRSVQGGFAPGFDDASNALRRGAARGITDASLNAELGIKERVNAGRMGGAQALSQAEGALQGLRTGNMYAGMTGAGGMDMNMQNAINSGMLSGAGGLHNMSVADLEAQGINTSNLMQSNMFNAANQLGTDKFNTSNLMQSNQFNASNQLGADQYNASNLQQSNMFNTSNQMRADQFNASQRGAAQRSNAAAGRASAARSAANARYNAGMERENAIFNSRGQYTTDTGNRDFDWETRKAGIGGLQTIQGNDIAQSQAERDRVQNSYGMQYGAQGQAQGQQNQIAMQPGAGGTALNFVGGLAGAAAPFFTGGGAKPPTPGGGSGGGRPAQG